MESMEREQKLKQMIYVLLLFIAILGGIIIWNMVEIKNMRQVAGGDYVTMFECRQLIDQECGIPARVSAQVNISALSP